MAELKLPTNAERTAFVDKLGTFRGTLAPNERRMLDAMVVASVGSVRGEVQGYGLLDPAQRLGDALLDLIEQWGKQVALDDDGNPIGYLPTVM